MNNMPERIFITQDAFDFHGEFNLIEPEGEKYGTYVRADLVESAEKNWIPVTERLPVMDNIDDTPINMGGKDWDPMHYSKTVIVALEGGGIRTDSCHAMGENGKPFWFKYGDRVTHWMEVEHPTYKYIPKDQQ